MWARLANTAVGIWLMAAPAVLGYSGPAAINDRIVGPLAATFAIVAIWEVTRSLRWSNLALGPWLLAAPWLLGGYPAAAMISSLVAGALLALFSLVRGRIRQEYGGGWAAVWRSDDSGSGREP